MPRKQAAQVLGPRGPKVTVVKVEGYEFRTEGPDSNIWTDARERVGFGIDFEHPEWKHVRFVRLKPGPEQSEDVIAFVRGRIEYRGIDVQVITPQSPQVVLDQATPAYDDKGIRETVEDMVMEANTKNRTALEMLVQKMLTKVKL